MKKKTKRQPTPRPAEREIALEKRVAELERRVVELERFSARFPSSDEPILKRMVLRTRGGRNVSVMEPDVSQEMDSSGRPAQPGRSSRHIVDPYPDRQPPAR